MGLALPPLALGLAMAQPKRPVIAVEGDGALLMHMGILVTVGAYLVRPKNLAVLLIQNGVHAASGGQPLTNGALDLAALARASGIAHAENLSAPKALGAALGDPRWQRHTRPRAFDRARHRGGEAADRVRSGGDQTALHERDRRAALRADTVRRRTARTDGKMIRVAQSSIAMTHRKH